MIIVTFIKIMCAILLITVIPSFNSSIINQSRNRRTDLIMAAINSENKRSNVQTQHQLMLKTNRIKKLQALSDLTMILSVVFIFLAFFALAAKLLIHGLIF